MYPWVLGHGPLQQEGLDIPHLYTEQLLAHARMILRYDLDKTEPTGVLLHMMAKAMWLQVGINGKLLAALLILQDHVTDLWIKHVWVSTQECGVTLFTDFVDYPPQQHSNTKLMHLFIQSGLKQPMLQMVNQCQMYLQVFLLLDIVSGLDPITVMGSVLPSGFAF